MDLTVDGQCSNMLKPFMISSLSLGQNWRCIRFNVYYKICTLAAGKGIKMIPLTIEINKAV